MISFLDTLQQPRSATLKPVAKTVSKGINIPAGTPLNAPKAQAGLSLAGAPTSNLKSTTPVKIQDPTIPKTKASNIVEKGIGIAGQVASNTAVDLYSATKEVGKSWANVPKQTLQHIQGKKVDANPEFSESAKRGIEIVGMSGKPGGFSPELGAVKGNVGFITKQAIGESKPAIKATANALKNEKGFIGIEPKPVKAKVANAGLYDTRKTIPKLDFKEEVSGNSRVLKAFDDTGNPGALTYSIRKDGSLNITGIVAGDGKGVGRALVNEVRQKTGANVFHFDEMTPQGEGFWKAIGGKINKDPLTENIEGTITFPRVAQPTIGDIKPQIGTKLLGAGDPEARLREALAKNKGFRAEQEAIYTAQKGERIAKAKVAGERAGGGEAGFIAKKTQLTGAFDVAKNDNKILRNQISQSDLDGLINKIDSAKLTDFEKISTAESLVKLLDEGKIPTSGSLANFSKVFKPETIQAMLDTRTTLNKLKDFGVELANTPRSLMSTGDLSAPFRQGIFSAPAHPKTFVKDIKNMVGYWGSEQKFQNFYKELEQRPNYLKMREAGLEVTKPGMHGTNEEYFMSNLAERIPAIGKLVRASDRAYTGFLNNYRADLFDVIYKAGEKAGKGENEKFLKSLGEFVNTTTGRGDLKNIPIIGSLIGKQLQEAAPLLNAIFFAPRLIASRASLLNPVYYARLEPTVRKEAMKQAVSFTVAMMSVLGTAKLAGAEVGLDPRSADFGKIKVGNTRYDPWGGFQQWAVLIARLALNQSVSSTTGKVTQFGEGYKPTTRKEIGQRFLESKLGPIPSYANDALKGTDALGKPFNPVTGAVQRLSPMQWQDMQDKLDEYGPLGPVLSIPGLWGVGSQTYAPTSAKKKSIGTTIYK